MMARVDILLPYWGDFSLLKQTVESIIVQTDNRWHLTVVDDCYPSNEAALYVSSLEDSRVEYQRHNKNIGITNNFNYCIEVASAEYCVIIGCDDRLLPDYIETALVHIGKADLYQPSVDVIDANGNSYLPLVDRVKRMLRPKKSGYYSGEQLALSLCRGNWLYFPSIMWRTSTLKKYRFDAKYTVVEDVVVELDMVIDGAVLFFDTCETFQYRRFASSVSSKEKGKGGSRFKEEFDTYRTFAEKFDSIGWGHAARVARRHLLSRIHKLIS